MDTDTGTQRNGYFNNAATNQNELVLSIAVLARQQVAVAGVVLRGH